MSESKTEFRAAYSRGEYVELYYLQNAVMTKAIWGVMMTFLWTGVVLGAVYVALFGLPEDTNIVLFAVSAVMLVFAAVYLPVYPRFTRHMTEKLVDREYLAGDREDNIKTIRIGKKGLDVESFGDTRFFPWAALQRVRETPKAFLLRYESGADLLLPKEAMSEKNQETVRERCTCKIVLFP